MKKPTNLEEAKVLLWKRVEELTKKRVAYSKAERDYRAAREWMQELEAKVTR